MNPYLALTKPRITLMVVLSALAGMFLAGGWPATAVLVATVAGVSLSAGGANALNQAWERDADSRMERTKGRPVPAGLLSPAAATVFGLVLAAAGVAVLAIWTRPVTAVLAALTVGIYVLVYTPLKPRSSLSTIVGAVPGAFPIMGGWTAAGGALDAGAWALFGILFFWQLPHFLALAYLYKEDYSRGGLQMLPVEDQTGRQTRQQAVLYALALLPTSLLPSLLGLSGSVYAAVALTMSALYVLAALRFALRPDRAAAGRLFRTSLIYLPILLAVLALDIQERPAEFDARTPIADAQGS
ncbi:MAG: heme o synthase [Gemmatimonadota bacterium]